MKKNHVLTALLTVALMTAGAFQFKAMAGDTLSAPSEPITIDGKKPVKFPHSTHLDMGVTCGDCHHNSEHQALKAEDIGAMSDPAVLKCATCHNETFAKAELQNRKDIFHTNCKDCHKKGVGDKKGPTNCTACHGKSKKKAVEGC